MVWRMLDWPIYQRSFLLDTRSDQCILWIVLRVWDPKPWTQESCWGHISALYGSTERTALLQIHRCWEMLQHHHLIIYSKKKQYLIFNYTWTFLSITHIFYQSGKTVFDMKMCTMLRFIIEFFTCRKLQLLKFVHDLHRPNNGCEHRCLVMHPHCGEWDVCATSIVLGGPGWKEL